jgi:hypothetical protein
MTLRGIWLTTMAVLLMVNPVAGGHAPAMHSSELTAFMGTWVFDMTDPPDLVGTKETVRILEKNGVVAATVQVGRFPPNDVTGILKDGDLLVLTTTLRENGQPIWVVISLKQAGETMTLAQMMERSQTIKRGTAKKQAN